MLNHDRQESPVYSKIWQRLTYLAFGLGTSIFTGLSIYLLSADAAEKVTVRYSPIEQSIAVGEMRTFVDTGKQSSTIETVLGQVKQKPEDIRKLLGLTFDLKEYKVDLVTVEKILNTYIAELVLREMGRVAHPPRVESASVQALRGAIISSFADDGKISAIEFLEKYPTDLVIEGNLVEQIVLRIVKDIDDLNAVVNRLIRNLK